MFLSNASISALSSAEPYIAWIWSGEGLYLFFLNFEEMFVMFLCVAFVMFFFLKAVSRLSICCVGCSMGLV